MPISSTLLRRLSLLAGWVFPLCVHASGLSELKDALARHTASTPFKAQVEANTWNRNGEGKDAEERSGQVSVQLEENAQGMRIQFARDTLNHLAADEQAKQKNVKAKTPTLHALNALNAGELRSMANAGPDLARLLEKVEFKSERADTWNNQSARLLNFDLGLATMSEKDRKFVKKHEGSLDVWIAPDGTPLASRTHLNASGRAYVVISLEITTEEDLVYVALGDRLLAARKESHNIGAGAGDRGENRTIRTLQLLP